MSKERSLRSKELNGQKSIKTSVDQLLPGISHQEDLARTPLELSVSYDKSGQKQFQMIFDKVFTRVDVQYPVMFKLVDRDQPKDEEEARLKRRGWAKVKEEEKDEFDLEKSKILRIPTSNVLEKIALDLFTNNQATRDFLNGIGGRDYKKMYVSTDPAPPAEITFFMGEMAGLMKRNPNLWKKRKSDSLRISDLTAISRYAQLGNSARGNINICPQIYR